MIHRLTALAFGISLFTLGGCAASGPPFSEVASRIPDPGPGMGRIYFFRNYSMLGNAIRPDVSLDGQDVGASAPGGAFFVDKEPGRYTISCSTEATNDCEVDLEADHSVYIRTWIGMGLFVGHVYPEIVSDAEGEASVADCNYTGDESLLMPEGRVGEQQFE